MTKGRLDHQQLRPSTLDRIRKDGQIAGKYGKLLYEMGPEDLKTEDPFILQVLVPFCKVEGGIVWKGESAPL